MKIKAKWRDGVLIISHRVFFRRRGRFKAYLARITGPHPNYILERVFLPPDFDLHDRHVRICYKLSRDGIYELCVKRFSLKDRYLSRERLWLVVFNGKLYCYEDEEMNYRYVLYTAYQIRLQSQYR